VTYTDFQKIATISEGNKTYTLSYGVDDERRKSVYAVNGVTKLTHYYLGNYEEEIDAVGNIRKIHYLSGGDCLAAILVQNYGKDSLMYAYTDFQGSLSALTDESGNVLEKYAFDPWGNRRDPDDWSQEDSRKGWLVDRGYTLHEHLDGFGIINMNGRVYDPLTAVFFSPDPRLQSPDDWLNYNRYTYCLNNPLRYTDPTGDFYLYLIPNISWSPHGGLSVGLTAGIGFPKFGIDISASYCFKNQSWSITAGISAGGLNAYVGYGSQNGFMAGVGYNSFGIAGFSSNLTAIGVNYSQNGGICGNGGGAQITKNGVCFDPSISGSHSITIYNSEETISEIMTNADLGVTDRDHAAVGTDEQKDRLLVDNEVILADFGVKSVEMGRLYEGDKDKDDKPMMDNGYKRGSNGIILENGKPIGAVTHFEKGWFPTSTIYMSPFDTETNFIIALNHEFIHSWQWQKFGYKMNKLEWSAYTEASAYSNTQIYHSNCIIPTYKGNLPLDDHPMNLIPVH